jgi:hypothetical protein
MTFKAEIRASIGWKWDEGAVDDGRLEYAKQFLEGHGDGEAEAAWHAEDQTLPEGGVATLDLTALARRVLGDRLTTCLLRVKGLLVINHDSSTGRLVLGGAGGPEWSAPFGADGDTVEVRPQSAVLLANKPDGWPVDDANKLLRLAAAGGCLTYSIAVVGTTAADGSGSGG